MMRNRFIGAVSALAVFSAAFAGQASASGFTSLTLKDGVTPVDTPTPLPVTCPDGTCSGGGGSLSATASSLPTPVVAGANKPLNIGLFSNLFITPVSPTGTQIDLSNQCVWGVDAATCASLSNLFPTSAQLTAGTAIAGKFGIDQTTPGTTNRVSIDQTTPGTTNAVQVAPGTTGGASSYTFEVAASDNHQVVKNGAGTLYTADGFSIHTAAMFIRLYDAGTGFNGCNSATNLLWEGQIPAPGTTGAGFIKSWGDVGKAFTNGLSVCVTGAYGNTNTTAATASVASVNLGFK